MKIVDFTNLPQNLKTTEQLITKSFEADNHARELGIVGKLLGSGDSIKMNIAGITILILILTGIVYTIILIFCNTSNNSNVIDILKFWGILTPIITLSLGYIFGKSNHKL